jgi:uncharacterized membrane protein YvbJ
MFCQNCGNEINDEAVVCPSCGVPTDNYVEPAVDYVTKDNTVKAKKTVLQILAKFFLIISCVSSAAALIPLAWCIPMTLKYCKAIDKGEKVSTVFKLCTLIFVGAIPGALMFCDD